MRSYSSALDDMWSTAGALFLALSIGGLWVWPKFFGVDIHPIFGWAELKSGQGWLEPGGRYAVGAVAAVIAVLVLIPRTRLAGAWAGLVLSAAFCIAHLTPWLGVNIPNYGPLMEAIAAGKTAADVEAMGLKGDKGAHFSIALLNLGLAIMTIAAEKVARRPQLAPPRPVMTASLG